MNPRVTAVEGKDRVNEKVEVGNDGQSEINWLGSCDSYLRCFDDCYSFDSAVGRVPQLCRPARAFLWYRLTLSSHNPPFVISIGSLKSL